MREPNTPRLPKWPFFVGDGILIVAAGLICYQTPLPIGPWELGIAVACLAAGAFLAALPFILEYRSLTRVAEAGSLESVVSQIKNLESLASQISSATSQWQTVQEHAQKTSNAAREIADRMASELKSFTDFMQSINDREKSTLKLEVEKMRRGEAEWLQVLVRLLDHVYALHQAAVRSGQPNVINQLGQFQNACRDAARRIGLTPFAPEPAEPFNPERHQIAEGQAKPSPDSKVSETLATGYTYQGKLLRPALVRTTSPGNSANPGEAQNELELQPPQAS